MVYGYTITDVLNMWAAEGVFAYALPFLLIFAIVYGLLNNTKLLGDNKGVQATIALAFGLLSLQFDYVTNFYATIFPYAGVGIAVLLVALILMGVTGKDISWMKYLWLIIGALIFIFVLFYSFTRYNWFGWGFIVGASWPSLLAGLVLVLIIVWIVMSNK